MNQWSYLYWVATFFLLTRALKGTPVNSLAPRDSLFYHHHRRTIQILSDNWDQFPLPIQRCYSLPVGAVAEKAQYVERSSSSLQFMGTISTSPGGRIPPLSTRTSKPTGPMGPAKSKQTCLQWIIRCDNASCHCHLHPLVPDPCILTIG